MLCFLAAAAMDTPPLPPPVPIPCSVRSESDDSEFDDDGEDLAGTSSAPAVDGEPRAETDSPPVAPLFTCRPWGPANELVSSPVDCRFVKNNDGVPSFIEGVAWEACGDREIASWDVNASPPVPKCAAESEPEMCADGVTTPQDGQCPGALPPIIHRTDN